MQVLRQADLLLMVLRLDFTSLKNTKRFLDHLDGLGIPMDRVRLVVNRYGQPREVPLAKAEEALKMKVFHVIPDDPKVVNRANNNGVPVVLDAPSAKVSRAIAKLARAVMTPRPSPPPPDLDRIVVAGATIVRTARRPQGQASSRIARPS